MYIFFGILQISRHNQRDYFKAHEYLQKSQYEYELWYGRNHHVVSDVLHEFGRLLSNGNNTYQQNEDRAETLYRRALRLRTQAYGASSIKAAETMFALGKFWRQCGFCRIFQTIVPLVSFTMFS